MKHCLTLVLAASLSLSAWAGKKGKVIVVEMTHTVEVPDHMSRNQAFREGIIKAKNEAIDSAFSSVIGSGTDVDIRNRNGESDVSFHSAIRSNVRGIWLGDLVKPRFEETIDDDHRHLLSITVKGRIQELTSAGIPFDALPLRVKPEKQLVARNNEFDNGDDFFLYFKSPVDGFLTVFFFDTTADEISCMLPYHTSGTGSYRIRHDRDYIFFSQEKPNADGEDVDEFQMMCSDGNIEEYDEIFVVLSPNKYSKLTADIAQEKISESLILPERMNYDKFQKWLVDSQQKDEDMQVMRIPILIRNK